ncbi:11541_t:CDS:2, partial [Racocetra persica]
RKYPPLYPTQRPASLAFRTCVELGISSIAEVYEYVRSYNICNRTTSIKEKDDLTPVVSYGSIEYLQMDLVDFTAYKDINDRFSWLLIMGAPSILQSDNSKEFTANVIKHICKALEITIRYSRPRHLMSQGQVKHLNQTIRYSMHGKTSREVMFGYKLLGIYQQFNFANFQKIEVPETLTTPQTVEKHLKKVSAIHDEVNNQLEKSRKYMQKYSSVLHHNSPMNLKLQVNFKETGTIVNLMNNNKTVVVEIPSG